MLLELPTKILSEKRFTFFFSDMESLTLYCFITSSHFLFHYFVTFCRTGPLLVNYNPKAR